MTPFNILCLVALIAYSLEFLYLRIGFWKANSAPKNITTAPTVTVIVAARNEEKDIESCLSSLVKLEYPAGKLEIVVIDDHSTDKTYEIMTGFANRYPFLRTLQANPEEGNLKGKTNAITQAIESSSGEILMFTDADCMVSPNWVSETVKYFDEETGIVGGFTVLKANRTFEGIQALDWMILFSTASSTAGWNIPLTAIGNNISVRRRAYEETGGYRTIPFSVTEDYALVRAILEKTPFKLRFPLIANAFVSGNTCESWKQLFRQKQRWGIGGLDMITNGFIVFAVSWALNLLLLVGLFVWSPVVILGVFVWKIIIDAAYLISLLKIIRKINYLKYLLPFELYFTLYVIFIPFIALVSRKVIWKERSL